MAGLLSSLLFQELVTRVLTLALPDVLMPGLMDINTLRKRWALTYAEKNPPVVS